MKIAASSSSYTRVLVRVGILRGSVFNVVRARLKRDQKERRCNNRINAFMARIVFIDSAPMHNYSSPLALKYDGEKTQ